MPYIQYKTVPRKQENGIYWSRDDGKRITVDAVAVWSKGPNRKDDQGLSGWKENGKRTDDARAMLRIDPEGGLP